MSILEIIGCISPLLSVASFYVGAKKYSWDSGESYGETYISLKCMVESMDKTIREIKTDVKNITNQLQETKDQIKDRHSEYYNHVVELCTRLQEQCTALKDRVDKLEGKLYD